MSKLDALTNFEVFIKFMRKEGFLMKKMLAKAVVLGLVLGGIGFVANDAQAADIGNGVKVHSGEGFDGTGFGEGHDIKTEKKLGADAALAEQKDLVKVNEEATAAKDAADAAQTTANAAQAAAAKNADDIKTNADNINANKNAIEANSKAIKANGEAINTERDQRVAMDNALKKSIDTERDQRVAMDNVLDKKITDEATNRANEDKRIEAKFDGEVSRLDGRIDKLNDNVQKVGAMAAAIANLHTMGYDPEAPTEIAVGVGQYRDKTGMALGAFHYPNRDFMLSFSVSTAGDEYMGGIGATWKFGRKTPEELRQAEAEKAAKAKLAKAEAAKKAAKDARVAAQQKRHAEMLAARTAK